MCVVAIAWKAHPKWRLVVAGNRDEFHARASAPLSRWEDESGIIAGRDLFARGSWLGLSDKGRFAVVTNIRDADGRDANKASRGALVAGWLANAAVPQHVNEYNPFNLVVADLRSAQFISNRPGPTQEMLMDGIHGLSNAYPNEHWPRKDRLVAQMADWLAGEASQPDSLLDILIEDKAPDRDAYPVFIRSPVYGTRCSTVVAVNAEGQGQIIERRFDAGGTCSGETVVHFIWPQ